MARNPRADLDWSGKIWLRERVNDFGFTLAKIPWDTFNTLTFKNPVPRITICYGMAWRWCHAVAEIADVPYNRLLIALRGEFGESKGRFHFHCLIGGTSTRNSVSLAYKSRQQWWIIARKPRTECRAYNPSLAGADYISKCLGANEYELSKYSLADSVMLSRSVMALIRRDDQILERRYGEDNRQNGQVTKIAGFNQVVPAMSSLCDETATFGSGMSDRVPACP